VIYHYGNNYSKPRGSSNGFSTFPAGGALSLSSWSKSAMLLAPMLAAAAPAAAAAAAGVGFVKLLGLLRALLLLLTGAVGISGGLPGDCSGRQVT
jgi:hypothetical protein